MTTSAEITIDRRYAIWEAAAAHEATRISLTGVHFDPATKRAAAADGFILAVVPFDFDGTLDGPVLIPASFVKACAKASPKSGPVRIVVEYDEATRATYAHTFDKSARTLTLAATFPNYVPLLPTEFATLGPTAFAFDFNLTARLAKAIGWQPSTKRERRGLGVQMRFSANGASGPLVVTVPSAPDSVGVQMPIFSGELVDPRTHYPK